MSSHESDGRALERVIRRRAEVWFYRSLGTRLLTIAVGVYTASTSSPQKFSGLIVLGIYVLSAIFFWVYQNVRADWERLQRSLDLSNGFGWDIPVGELSDVSTKYEKHKKDDSLNADYFASNSEHGSVRAIENTQESAWYAKHIAETTFVIYMAIIGAIFIGLVLALIYFILDSSGQSVGAVGQNNLMSLARGAIVGFTFLVSLSLITTARGYWMYKQCADSIEKKTVSLLDSGDYTDMDAIRLMNEYHLCHATAPMNPTWIWKIKREGLNRNWEKYRRASYKDKGEAA